MGVLCTYESPQKKKHKNKLNFYVASSGAAFLVLLREFRCVDVWDRPAATTGETRKVLDYCKRGGTFFWHSMPHLIFRVFVIICDQFLYGVSFLEAVVFFGMLFLSVSLQCCCYVPEVTQLHFIACV